MGSGWTYWQCLEGTKSVTEREERTSKSRDKLGGKIEIHASSQNQRTSDSLQTNQAKDIFRKGHLSRAATSNCWFPKAFLALSFLMEKLRGEEVGFLSQKPPCGFNRMLSLLRLDSWLSSKKRGMRVGSHRRPLAPYYWMQ